MHGKKEQSLVQSFRRRRQVSHSGGYIDTRESDRLGPVVFSAMWTDVGKAVTPFLSRGSREWFLANGR
jgi:hypothetical protein